MNGDETLFGRWLNDRLATLQRHDAGDERCILSLVQSRSEQLGRMYWCELPRREFLESIEDAKQELTQSADWEV